jgi:3-dehydroquinate synthase
MSHTFELSDYSIFLGDLAENFPAWLREHAYSQIFILTDENTKRDCLEVFLEKANLTEEVKIAEIPAGEHFKTLAVCQQIWQQMLEAKLDRKALVVNLGGGVIGDIGGFCAATWKRGVDFVQVPTTLLAMTDAAIGGKLGIDFQGVKNTIGVFRNPSAVFVDPVFLKTLPERELRSGFAEVIKHAFIANSTTDFQIRPALRDFDGIGSPSYNDWLETLRDSIAVKVRVVQEDPLENGLRAILNFGHSIGHALESYFLKTKEPLTHGEAVAIGMICESQIGNLEKLEGAIEVIKKHFPHRPIPESAFPEIWNLMQQDKKNAAGKVRMAVPGEEPFSMRISEPNREEIERSLLFYNSLK